MDTIVGLLGPTDQDAFTGCLHRSTASAVRTTSFLVLSALASIGAAAATAGSTDIYASNGVAASFGAAAKQSGSSLQADSYSGPTDTWGVNGFRLSFGPADSIAPATNVCGSGSTDVYGFNGFAASFGAPASKAVIDLAQACRAPVTAVR